MSHREYIALWDDGHDKGRFKFFSESRKGSAQNEADAKAEYWRTHRRKCPRITDIYLSDED